MAYTLYILRSETSGRLYIGQTNNLPRRLHEHQSGQTPSTRGRGPCQLVYTQDHDTRAEAVAQERHLKNMKSQTRVVDWIAAR